MDCVIIVFLVKYFSYLQQHFEPQILTFYFIFSLLCVIANRNIFPRYLISHTYTQLSFLLWCVPGVLIGSTHQKWRIRTAFTAQMTYKPIVKLHLEKDFRNHKYIFFSRLKSQTTYNLRKLHSFLIKRAQIFEICLHGEYFVEKKNLYPVFRASKRIDYANYFANTITKPIHVVKRLKDRAMWFK